MEVRKKHGNKRAFMHLEKRAVFKYKDKFYLKICDIEEGRGHAICLEDDSWFNDSTSCIMVEPIEGYFQEV